MSRSSVWQDRSRVCWFGLCTSPAILARTLLYAMPAQLVTPSSSPRVRRMSAAMWAPATRRLSQPQAQSVIGREITMVQTLDSSVAGADSDWTKKRVSVRAAWFVQWPCSVGGVQWLWLLGRCEAAVQRTAIVEGQGHWKSLRWEKKHTRRTCSALNKPQVSGQGQHDWTQHGPNTHVRFLVLVPSCLALYTASGGGRCALCVQGGDRTSSVTSTKFSSNPSRSTRGLYFCRCSVCDRDEDCNPGADPEFGSDLITL